MGKSYKNGKSSDWQILKMVTVMLAFLFKGWTKDDVTTVQKTGAKEKEIWFLGLSSDTPRGAKRTRQLSKTDIYCLSFESIMVWDCNSKSTLCGSSSVTIAFNSDLPSFFFFFLESKCSFQWLVIVILQLWFGWFYGMSTIIGYLMLNPVYTYILNIYDLWTHFVDTHS